MSSAQKIIQAAAGNVETAVEPVGIDFDGTNDYLSRSSDLTGNADGKTFTFSAWVWKNAALSRVIYVSDNGSSNEGVRIDVVSNGSFQVQAWNASASRVVYAEGSAVIPIRTWTHVIVSVDLSATTVAMYVNDEAVSLSPTLTNDNIDFTKANHAIARNRSYSGADEYDGRLAGVYLDYTYRDLSVEANRRLFIDDDGLYVTPPTSGIISVPMDDPADPGRNDGTGGDFTLNGVVAQSGRGPTQYNAAASTFDGSADYLSANNYLNNIDGNKVSFSGWIKPRAASSFILGYSAEFNVRMNNTGTVSLGYKPDNTVIDGQSTTTFAPNEWHHIAFSVNCPSATTTLKVVVDGIDISSEYSPTNRDSANTFGFENFVVGSGTSSNITEQELSDVWFTFGTNLDFTDAEVLAKFRDPDTGKPVYLGENGELPTGSTPTVYLPLRANDAGNNLGSRGNLTVNSGPYTGARGPSEFWGESAVFNGTNQYLRRTSIVGLTDSTDMSVVAFFTIDNGSHDGGIITVGEVIGNVNEGFGLYQSRTNLVAKLSASSGTTLTASGVLSTSTDWYTAMFSTTSGAQRLYVYKNNVLVSSVTRSDTYTTPDITTGKNYVGRLQDEFEHDGKIGFLWFNTEYVDFSQEANRLKFVDGLGYPVDLGEDGSTPTGSQPLIYLNEGFHLGTNLGSGGNFTPVNTPTAGGYVKN